MSEERVDITKVKSRVKIEPPKDSDTVTVACKLPNGIILHGSESYETYEPLMGGGSRKITLYRRTEESIKLNGNAISIDQFRSGAFEYNLTKGTEFNPGYALTSGISRKFMEQWLENYKDSALVKNKIIFIADDDIEARAEAKEYQELQSGLEPINPDNPSTKSSELRGIQKGKRNDDDMGQE